MSNLTDLVFSTNKTVPIANGGTGHTTAAGARTNLGGTTAGVNLFTLTNPSAVTFLRVNADNTVSALDAATFRTAIGAGTVTSVSGTGTVSGLTLSGSVTSSGSLTLGGTLTLTSSQVTTALGFTPYNSTNPSGYTSNTGTVTSVSGTGSVSGLTLSGTVTSSGSLTLGGTLTLTSGQVTTALGFTPYNSTNPSGYITSSSSITGSSRFVAFLDTRATDDQPQGKTGYVLSADFKNNASVNNPPVTSGNGYSHILTVAGWDTAGGSGGWPSQLSIGDGIAVRQANSATAWGAWRTVLHSNNYTSYSPTLTGSGASGTWGISITGSAATLGGKPAQDAVGANTIPTRDGSGYTYFNYINSNTGNSENPSVSQVIVTNGSDGFYRKASIAHLTSAVQSNASGTWSINVTGSAGSASTASTANALATGNNYQMNSLGVGTGAGSGGEIRATSNITAYYSDDRLKTRLGLIENALDKLCSLSGFYYEANEVAQSLGYTPVREVGLSAQETQRVLPEVVVPAPIDDKYLTIRYEKVIPLIVEAIKELRAELVNLKQAQH